MKSFIALETTHTYLDELYNVSFKKLKAYAILNVINFFICAGCIILPTLIYLILPTAGAYLEYNHLLISLLLLYVMGFSK